jgi:hypothetical protein
MGAIVTLFDNIRYNCYMARARKFRHKITFEESQARKQADRLARMDKQCQCRVLDHDKHFGAFCSNELGEVKHYYHAADGSARRICNYCATQISSSQDKILELPP